MYTANNVKTPIQLEVIFKWYSCTFGALKRAFRFNFTCLWPLGARNANGTNSGAPERRCCAFQLTLTTDRGGQSAVLVYCTDVWRPAVDGLMQPVDDVGRRRRVSGRCWRAARHSPPVTATVRPARRLYGRTSVNFRHLSTTTARACRRLYSTNLPSRSVIPYNCRTKKRYVRTSVSK